MHHSVLSELARALTSDEFVARLPEPVLVVMSELLPDAATADEDTQVGEEVVAGLPTENRSFPDRFEALALRKKRHAADLDRITIGRDRTSDIVVRTPGVSKVHAYFVPGAPLQIVDRGSQNGTYIDGERIPAGRPVVLQFGQEIVFGDLVTRLLTSEDLYGVLKRHGT